MHTSVEHGRSEVRVVVLNKSDNDDCLVTLQLNNAFGDGRVTRVQPDDLTGPGRMKSKVIKYGGAAYKGMSGLLNVPAQSEASKVTHYRVATGRGQKLGSRYTLNMPTASAAILVAHDSGSAIVEAGDATAAVATDRSIITVPADDKSSSAADEELMQLEKSAASQPQPVPSSLNVY